MIERDVEQRLIRRVQGLGGECWKLAPLGVIGIPDRLVLLPGGRCAFAEIKAPGEKPRKLQVFWLNRLRGLGFVAVCLDTIEAVEEFVGSL